MLRQKEQPANIDYWEIYNTTGINYAALKTDYMTREVVAQYYMSMAEAFFLKEIFLKQLNVIKLQVQ